jgi:cytochrome c553
MRRLLRSTGCLLWLLGVHCLSAQAATPAFFPASAERGRALAAPCLVCHAAPNAPTGIPPVRPPKLAGQRAEAIFIALLAYQRGDRAGPVMRPLVAALSLQNMRDLGAYLAAEGPAQPPKPVGEGSWAQDRVHRDCTACHGQTGMGEMWGIPVIAGQHRDYLTFALNAYRDGTRKDATMAAVVAKLTAEEISKLAEYFSLQSHLRLSE